ncbi:MAG TPA: hypothetical protein VGR46_14365 [Candidatus Limnocylindria bacterium]|nr:hypothetical protein [Candidatus Limnocylindria bacterium]
MRPSREDPLPALETSDVLTKRLAQQLAPAAALGARDAIHFASQPGRQ